MGRMTARHHDFFEAIRDEVVDRLAGGRGGPRAEDDEGTTQRLERGVDALVRAPHRAHIGGVVARMQRFVETDDLGRFREFLHRWAAMRLGEGGSPESILHAVAGIGDAILQLVHERGGDGADAGALTRDVARASFWATRLTVEVLIEELERREREHRELVEGPVG
jgi:hypothetical protein